MPEKIAILLSFLQKGGIRVRQESYSFFSIQKLFFILMLVSAFCMAATPCMAKEKSYLGMPQSRWEETLKQFPVHNHLAFYEALEKSAEDLTETNNARHSERLGQDGALKEKHKNNPLLQFKPKRTGSGYMTSLNLDNSDFVKMETTIKVLAEGYSEQEIAEILPYVAFCLNKDIWIQDIRFYCRWFVQTNTPVDVAKERLYRLVENTDEFGREIWKE
jgi:hypothetical protein